MYFERYSPKVSTIFLAHVLRCPIILEYCTWYLVLCFAGMATSAGNEITTVTTTNTITVSEQFSGCFFWCSYSLFKMWTFDLSTESSVCCPQLIAGLFFSPTSLRSRSTTLPFFSHDNLRLSGQSPPSPWFFPSGFSTLPKLADGSFWHSRRQINFVLYSQKVSNVARR